MNTDVMFSKASDEWSTPQDFYDELQLEFLFQWDAAATKQTSKTGWYNYFGLDHTVAEYKDALQVEWITFDRRRIFLNPPYSQVRAFMAKAANAVKNSWSFGVVVCLVPARTDTRWWHEYVWNSVQHRPRLGVEVRFIKGRLKFGDAKASAPFPSALVIFRLV